jgi:hypothetical protein
MFINHYQWMSMVSNVRRGAQSRVTCTVFTFTPPPSLLDRGRLTRSSHTRSSMPYIKTYRRCGQDHVILYAIFSTSMPNTFFAPYGMRNHSTAPVLRIGSSDLTYPVRCPSSSCCVYAHVCSDQCYSYMNAPLPISLGMQMSSHGFQHP